MSDGHPALPDTFQFSQHSLGDLVDCPRRFYLRYVAGKAWPLVETSPASGLSALEYQEYLRRGSELHRRIERHWLGIEPGVAPSGDAADAELDVWWSRFAATDFSSLPPVRLPELELVAPLGRFRLYARFDLLALPESSSGGSGQVVIVDWKTLRGDRPPSHAFLKNRIQTRTYLYVLATAGAPYHGGAPYEPEQCVMRYWLANFPERPWVEIGYARAEYERDGERLGALAEDAARRVGEAAFEKTDDERNCTYCNYRTLCRRRGAVGAIPPDELSVSPVDAEAAPALEY